MTIHLPEDLEASLREAVDSGRFASPEDAVAQAVRWFLRRQDVDQGRPGTPPHKPIWEVAEEVRKGVPADEWAGLPADGAEQHDHYIYGTPKRPAS
jgi:Arc/MetJ-type ribon-helix-helix transcriptional regulator